MRMHWPEEWTESFSLAGEIDKSRHPLIRGEFLDNAKPDLLIHKPGIMGNNLAAIEIKSLRERRQSDECTQFQRDLQKLAAFCNPPANYEQGFFIVFGEAGDRVRRYIQDLQHRTGRSFARVTLCHHARPGEAAEFEPIT